MDLRLNSDNDRKAKVAAFLFALLLLFLILYPFWSYTFPPPEKEGILVSFGSVEVVGSDVVRESQKEKLEESEVSEKEVSESKVSKTKEIESKKSSPTKVTEVKSPLAEKSPVVAKKKVAAKVPSEAEKKQAEEASKTAAAAKKKAEYEKAKKQFGDILGKGKGATSKSGNSGDTEGDPNMDALKGVSKGNGKIAGGLADRGLAYEPAINENSQKSGIVVVKVCVGKDGKVSEALYTQRGSTTTDSDLVSAAIKGAKAYRFSKSPIEKQCGTITIEFKLK